MIRFRELFQTDFGFPQQYVDEEPEQFLKDDWEDDTYRQRAVECQSDEPN